jgi:hypothetical protein
MEEGNRVEVLIGFSTDNHVDHARALEKKLEFRSRQSCDDFSGS